MAEQESTNSHDIRTVHGFPHAASMTPLPPHVVSPERCIHKRDNDSMSGLSFHHSSSCARQTTGHLSTTFSYHGKLVHALQIVLHFKDPGERLFVPIPMRSSSVGGTAVSRQCERVDSVEEKYTF